MPQLLFGIRSRNLRKELQDFFQEKSSWKIFLSHSPEGVLKHLKQHPVDLLLIEQGLLYEPIEEYLKRVSRILSPQEYEIGILLLLSPKQMKTPLFWKNLSYLVLETIFLPDKLSSSWVSYLFSRIETQWRILQELRKKQLLERRISLKESLSFFSFSRKRWFFSGNSSSIGKFLTQLNYVIPSSKNLWIKENTGLPLEELVQEIFRQKKENSLLRSGLFPIDFQNLPLLQQQLELFSSLENLPSLIELSQDGMLLLKNIECLSWIYQEELYKFLKKKKGEIYVVSTSKFSPEELINKGILQQRLATLLSPKFLSLPSIEERKIDLPDMLESYFIEKGWKISLSPIARYFLINHEWKDIYKFEGFLRDLFALKPSHVDVSLLKLLIEKKPLQFSPFLEAFQEENLFRHQKSLSPEELEKHLFREGLIESGFMPSLETVERVYIQNILRETKGNISQAARILGISRKTLYGKIRKYGLEGKNVG